MIHNPILRGFNPDPSICRVGEDYYLVTSSFSYFPGVPVYHSRDLMHWERLCYALDRKEQLHVTYEDLSLGIFAPTIRWHDNTFYLIATNMTTHQNFFCTATDPAGPWSDPVVIKGAGGIDPSLFWDDDGKVYYTGTAPWDDPKFDHPMIVCSEVDLETGQLTGELWPIGDGAAKDAYSPEGPHLYRRNGWYYLVIAEGGTEHNHAVTVSRSRTLHGSFIQCPANPVLTHRHLGRNYPICNVGHADLVECQDGSWYAVCLGSRLVNGYHKPLGRETFIVPVIWEEDWPVFSPGTGKVEWQYPAPQFAAEPTKCEPFPESTVNRMVQRETVDPEWNYLGTPYQRFVRVVGEGLAIQMLKTNLVPWEFEGEKFEFFEHLRKLGKTKTCMPFLGIRLREPHFVLEITMDVQLQGKESAGIVILQNNAHQLRLEGLVSLDGELEFRVVRVVRLFVNGKIHYEEDILGRVLLPQNGHWRLHMEGENNRYQFAVRPEDEDEWQPVAEDVDGTHLGTEMAGGFVGAYVGIFATGNGIDSTNEALFHKLILWEKRSI